jgi:hypothetical protein
MMTVKEISGNKHTICIRGFYQELKYSMNNVGKPALYGLTHSTIGTFFPENHLILLF